MSALMLVTLNNDAVLLREREGSVAHVTLSRPRARNALNSDLVEALAATFAALDDDTQISAIVLEGSPPGFCAGSDVKELASMSVPEMARHESRAGQVVRGIANMNTPVIAAVEGFAIGGGFLLATGCDVVVTSANARWHLPEVSMGWIPPWGLKGLVLRVGVPEARRLAWGLQPLTGEEAHKVRVADVIAEPGKATEDALELAQTISGLPTHSVTSTKNALGQLALDDAEAFDAQTTRDFALDCSFRGGGDYFSR